MPLTIQDVRREVRTALSRISIIDSDTIQVVSGDKPLQPSVKAGAGVTGGAGIDISAGVVSIADFDSLPDIDPNPDLTELFVAIWNDQIGGFPQSVSLQDLLTLTPNVADQGTSSSPDLITFFDVGSSANFTTTILNFLSDNVALIDHGGLGGLADVADHPAYLLVDGTRDLTGELDLDGNKLVLSADGLSSIQSLSSTFVSLIVNNVGVMSWTDTLASISVPLTLGINNALTFSAGSQLVSDGSKELDVVLDSTVKVRFRETFASFTTDIQLNDNAIVLSSTEEIIGTGGVVTMKVADLNQVVWSDGLLEMGLASSPYVISSRAPQTGGVSLFTIRGADAIFEGSGGTLKFFGGLGNADADGTVQLASSDEVVRLEVLADGTLDLNGPIAAHSDDAVLHTFDAAHATDANTAQLILRRSRGTTVSPTAVTSGTILGSHSFHGYGDTGFGQGALFRSLATQTHSDSAHGSNLQFGTVPDDGTAVALHLSIGEDGTFDFQTRRLTNYKGRRETFTFGFHNTSTATTKAPNYISQSSSGNSAKRGQQMRRAGSVIGVQITCDINVVGSGDTLEGRALVDGSLVLAAEIDSLVVANGLESDWTTQATGIDTFAAGQYIFASRRLTGTSPGQVTTDDFIISVEVEYDQ